MSCVREYSRTNVVSRPSPGCNRHTHDKWKGTAMRSGPRWGIHDHGDKTYIMMFTDRLGLDAPGHNTEGGSKCVGDNTLSTRHMAWPCVCPLLTFSLLLHCCQPSSSSCLIITSDLHKTNTRPLICFLFFTSRRTLWKTSLTLLWRSSCEPYGRTDARTHTCEQTHTHTHICEHTHTHMRTHTHTHTYANTHKHAHTHTHMQTHTH